MPDSMYDRLGDILSKAIESGSFSLNKPNSPSSKKTPDSAESLQKTSPNENNPLKKEINLSSAPNHVKKAAETLKMPKTVSLEKAKSIFRNELKKNHPDKNLHKNISAEIPAEKTSLIIESWKILENWLEKQI